MEKTKFSCDIFSNRSSDINIGIFLNKKEISFQKISTDPTKISIELDDDKEYLLEIIISGKTNHDTVVDAAGNILQDTVVNIQNIEFDGTNIDQIFYQKSKYHHDFNGNGKPTLEKFSGIAGCNGTISLDFCTPIYLWLLENM